MCTSTNKCYWKGVRFVNLYAFSNENKLFTFSLTHITNTPTHTHSRIHRWMVPVNLRIVRPAPITITTITPHPLPPHTVTPITPPPDTITTPAHGPRRLVPAQEAVGVGPREGQRSHRQDHQEMKCILGSIS